MREQVIDMPLLFESGFAAVTSPNVLVACSPEVQLARLMARDGLQHAAAEARAAAQMLLERKRSLADVVIENDGSRQELAAQVRVLVRRLERRAWLHRLLLSPAGVAAACAALLASVL
jgi:dephospho-CoA kinase